MTDRIDSLQAQIARLTSRVEALERQQSVVSLDQDDLSVPPSRTLTPASQGLSIGSLLPLIGRTLLVLGGAYLLRMLTESKAVPDLVGAYIGVAYASFWMTAAGRTALRGRRRAAMSLAFTSVVISMPLFWEAIVKFGYLPPRLGAATLAAFILLALIISHRSKLPSLSWAIALPGAPLAVAIGFHSGHLTAFFGVLYLLAAVVFWLEKDLAESVCSLYVALVANFAVMIILVVTAKATEIPAIQFLSKTRILWIMAVPIVIYFGLSMLRIAVRKTRVTLLEMAQVVLAALVGLVAISIHVHRTQSSWALFGAVCLLAGGGCYAGASALWRVQKEAGRNYQFISSLGLGLFFFALAFALGRTLGSLGLAALALISLWFSIQRARATPLIHSMIYFLGALVTSGTLRLWFVTFIGSVTDTLAWVDPRVAAALLVAFGFLFLHLPRHDSLHRSFSDVARLLGLAALIISLDAFLVTLAKTLDPGFVSALGTTLLAATTILLAWLLTKFNIQYRQWFIFFLLGLIGLKLLGGDLRLGRASTLFVSFVAYGLALILSPRLLHQGASEPDSEDM